MAQDLFAGKDTKPKREPVDLFAGSEPGIDPTGEIPAVGPDEFRNEYYGALNGALVGDQPPSTTQAPGEGNSAMNVLGEFAASANRSVTELIDFLGPDSVNAILRLAGSDKQMPTLTGALEGTGIQGGFMEPGIARDAVQAGGALTTAAGGMVPVTRQAGNVGNVMQDMLGLGSSAPAQVGAKTARSLSVARGTGDVDTAGFKVAPTTPGVEAPVIPKVVKDKTAREVVSQGFDEGLVAMVKTSTDTTKKNMHKMIDVLEAGKKNFKYGSSNRPIDVVGKSIVNRVNVVKSANRVSGQRLNTIAKGLKGESVDVSPAVNQFLDELDQMGVKFDPAAGKVSFSGSDIEGRGKGVKQAQKIIMDTVDRMLNTQNPDAYDVHRMKRYLSEQVNFGKQSGGVSGNMDRILKGLRHNLDGVLDEQFPAYKKVNEDYAQTVSALNSLQDVAGSKIDFFGENADKALGTLSRRLLSNAQSRIPLMDSLAELDAAAQKYSRPGSELVPYKPVLRDSKVNPQALDDDLMAMVRFVDSLEEVLGPSAQTSLFGDVAKATSASDIAHPDMTMTAVKAVGAGVKKLTGKSPDKAISAFRKMLEESM